MHKLLFCINDQPWYADFFSRAREVALLQLRLRSLCWIAARGWVVELDYTIIDL
jgi:hypothetical protein